MYGTVTGVMDADGWSGEWAGPEMYGPRDPYIPRAETDEKHRED